MDFTIDVSDLKSLAKYKAAGPIIVDEMTKAMTRSAFMVETTAKQLVPVDTGRLRAAITHEPIERGGDTITAKVGVYKVTYARDVEFGTKPHLILPRFKKALFWKGAEHPVRSVNHPGTRPQPYLIPGLQRNLGRISAEFRNVAGRVFARLGASR